MKPMNNGTHISLLMNTEHWAARSLRPSGLTHLPAVPSIRPERRKGHVLAGIALIPKPRGSP